MLHIIDRNLVDSHNHPIKLRGINLGGWLMMEGYILGGENIPESQFKASLLKEVGPELTAEFIHEFRQRFITESDIKKIKELGFNCIRLPFHYKLLEQDPQLAYLNSIVNIMAKYGLYVILDMHALPGAQGPEWHADSSGKALFWGNQLYQEKFIQLWHQLSDTFKDNHNIAAYDLMNEPVTTDSSLLHDIYSKAIDVIRQNKDQHIIFIEGNNWARDAEPIKDLLHDNVALSIHWYDPLEFTFNRDPATKYPGKVNGFYWDRSASYKKIKKYAEYKCPILVGEFGFASAKNEDGLTWLRDILSIFDKLDYHWTYWTYKAVQGQPFPDGLLQYTPDEELNGMNNIGEQLLNNKQALYEALDTRHFNLNQPLMNLLKSDNLTLA
ncbi:MAG: cellulase family glycosylhydrolase [bacterium]